MWDKSRCLSIGVAAGAVIGVALGAATHQMGVWLSLGIGVGLAIGVALRDRKQAVCRMNETQRKSFGS